MTRRPLLTRPALLALPLLLAAAGPLPTPAPDRPVMQPTKDALVGYHLAPAAGEAIDIRVAYRAGAKAIRFNLPDTSYVVTVPATRRVTMVVPLQQTTAELGWAEGPQSLFLLDEKARFTRRGELTVAGQKCTQWDATLDQDRRTVCVTSDGLLLRNESQDPQGRRNLVEATIVRIEPVPDAVFAIPAGYDKIEPEAGAPR